MARTIQTTIMSFLSTAVFFATFLLVGDVLIAATAAVGTTLVQFVIRQSTQQKSGVLMWASLALILALTGLTITGDDAFASTQSQAKISGHETTVLSKCSCRVPAGLTEARLTAAPAL